MYAQTNVQLFNELKRRGYSKAELSCVLNAHEFAATVFTGRFQPSGNTFIAHVVRTAGILASLHAPAEVVAAALIHSVFRNGDFGFGKTGISESKRQQVRQAVGREVEDYVYRFEGVKWSLKRIPTLRDELPMLGPVERNVILMRLANELEHHLDFDILYYGDAQRQRMIQHGPIMVEMAEKLGFPALASDLERANREAPSGEIPAEIRVLTERHPRSAVVRTSGPQESILIAPRSYRRRLWAKIAHSHYIWHPAAGLRRRLSRLVDGFLHPPSAGNATKKESLLLRLIQRRPDAPNPEGKE